MLTPPRCAGVAQTPCASTDTLDRFPSCPRTSPCEAVPVAAAKPPGSAAPVARGFGPVSAIAVDMGKSGDSAAGWLPARNAPGVPSGMRNAADGGPTELWSRWVSAAGQSDPWGIPSQHRTLRRVGGTHGESDCSGGAIDVESVVLASLQQGPGSSCQRLRWEVLPGTAEPGGARLASWLATALCPARLPT